jgi:hypothetical protein
MYGYWFLVLVEYELLLTRCRSAGSPDKTQVAHRLNTEKPPHFIIKFPTPGLWLISISCTSPDVFILRPLDASNGCPGFAHVSGPTPFFASILFHIIVKVLALSPCL